MNKSINCKFKIKVVGIGDFGISIVESLAQKNTPNVEYLDMNTDWAFMYECKNTYLKIGKKRSTKSKFSHVFKQLKNVAKIVLLKVM